MIDTHLHLLYPDRFRYAWTEGFPALQDAFTLEDYEALRVDTPIEAALFMEVDVDEAHTLEEARFLCSLCEGSALCGVIAGCKPERDDFAQQLDAAAHPALKGIRRVLHTQPDGVSGEARFREGVRGLAARNLSFDLCVRQDQLTLAGDLVAACPHTRFMLDHMGSPRVPDGFEQWREDLKSLAALDNLFIKFSGLSTYAPGAHRGDSDLMPYVETMFECFGTDRVVWGSDWPVVNLGEGLSRWCGRSHQFLEALSNAEKQKVFTDNARSFYQVTLS